MIKESDSNSRSLGERFKDEMREYLFISLYLWVCFSVLIIYGNSLGESASTPLIPLTTALIKALVIGKFILIGKALKPGQRRQPGALYARILWKSISMLVVLLLFTLIEEMVLGLVHGSTIGEVATELAAKPPLQIVAPVLLMLLVLIPMIGFEEVDRELGEGTLRHLLFGKRSTL